MKKTLKTIVSIILTVTVLFSLTAVTVSAESPKLSKTSASLYEGDSITLKVSNTADTVKWSSSDKAVAAVSSSGKVTAVKAGTATITASVSGSSLTCKVTVKKPIATDAPKIKGQWIEKEGYTLFKKSDGKLAKGWNEIDGLKYYFYPNGVVEVYDFFYDKKLVNLSAEDASFTGLTADIGNYIYYYSGTLKKGTTVKKFEKDVIDLMGEENFARSSDKEVPYVCEASNYLAGNWFVGDYYFGDKNSEIKQVGNYVFEGHVEIYDAYYNDGSIADSFKKKENLNASFTDAFGAKPKKTTDADGVPCYLWSNVNGQNANVQVYYLNNDGESDKANSDGSYIVIIAIT